MKKIILLLIITFWILSYSSVSAETNTGNDPKWKVKVTVSEKIPGLKCPDSLTKGKLKKWQGTQKYYDCEVHKWAKSLGIMLGKIIKYFTFIAGLVWVLFIVVSGIMYSMWGIDQAMKDKAKERIGMVLIWMMLLLMSGIILNLIAPWIYQA